MNHYDPLDTDSQDKQRSDALLAEELAAQTEVGDVKWLMGSKRGRRMVWCVLDRANLFGSSFNPNSMTMAHAEGNKTEARRWQRLAIFHCADLFTLMLKEQGK